jgi:hypothetical protein
MLKLVSMGNPLSTRNPHGYGFGQNFIPVMGMSFLADIFFFRRYEFGQIIPSGFLPIVISNPTHNASATARDRVTAAGRETRPCAHASRQPPPISLSSPQVLLILSQSRSRASRRSPRRIGVHPLPDKYLGANSPALLAFPSRTHARTLAKSKGGRTGGGGGGAERSGAVCLHA